MLLISRTRLPDGTFVTLLTDITERKRAEAEVQRAKTAAEEARKQAEMSAAWLEDSNKELEKARTEAEEATKAKSSFLAMMSHEIRTPMNGVMSMAEMLDQTDLTDDQRSMSGTIRSSAGALLTIINDILDFSKIEAGKLDIEKVPFSLVDTVEAVGELLIPRAEDKGVELVVDLDPSIPDALVGDPTRLRQVALNLAGNAVKFTERGSVSLVVRRTGGGDAGSLRLRFEVRDTGIGLSPEQRAKLFQPFQQADTSTSRKFGGTGLGLSISLKLVEMMGGAIGVESELGVGSTFWFELPFGMSSPEPDRPAIDISDAGIVVVDVAGQRREIAERLLEAAGIRGTQFVPSDSFDHTQLCARGDKGVIVIGAVRDGDTALAIARRVTGDPALSGWKPVLVTSRALASTMAEADRAGFFATLTVPVRRRRFWRVIAAALGRADLDARVGTQDADIGWAPPPLDEALAAGAAVLVAEDNATNQLVVARLLGQRGYAFEIADNGALALAALEGRNFGLLLTDFHMPEMDGFELTEAVRAREAARGLARLPIVALTADALPGTEQKCLDAGMDGYLTKPIDSKALTAMLAKYLPAAADLRRRPAPAAPAAKAKTVPEIDPAIFERVRVEEMFGGWNDEARAFFGSFLDGAPDLIAKVDAALAAADAAAARDAAHALKGAARSMGAVRLGQLASDMQDVLDAGDLDTAGLLQSMLAPTLQELVDATRPIR
jgi:signal transduction histidine kinase/CheY-like chemotaxis protein/HPt (histidine-containing phosphotransfer) domain-containing protein